jgi:hypothetical protein
MYPNCISEICDDPLGYLYVDLNKETDQPSKTAVKFNAEVFTAEKYTWFMFDRASLM